ncbi:WS/DGAT domain-containing protein [Streptomyces sp. I05A-00742]|uniref:WS/DGAT domain-containing protein n=1 Tax=Streptomyces sp. I05A-00742 TaxID=2732853 RepID=UPI001488A79E
MSSLLTTNVPGPPGEFRVRSWRLEHVVPLTFLPPGHALAATIMDYGGEVCVSFTARAHLADTDGLPRMFGEAVRELCAAPGARGPGGGRGDTGGLRQGPEVREVRRYGREGAARACAR